MTHRFHPYDEPDAQSLLDFGDALADGTAGTPANELEATMLRVQHGLRATSLDHDTMPDDIRLRIREELMNTAAPPVDIAGQHPESIEPRPKARRRQPSASIPSHPMRRMAWSGAANIALAVMILIAAFGAWRLYDDTVGTGGGNTPGEGQYAMAPLIATPAMTAEPSAFACDFSQDIPIFPDVSQSPIDGTSLYLTPRNEITGNLTGTLMLHCPQEPDDIELAQNILSASPGPWQGIVSLSILPASSTDLAEQYPAFLNIETNRQVAFGTGDSQRFWVQQEQGSPWVVGPSLDDLSITQVVDLRTMETRRLDDLSGISMPDKKMVMLSTPADNGTVALGYSGNQYDLRLSRNTGAPGDLLILGASFDDSHWVTLDEALPIVSGIKLSPDASHAALKLNTSSDTNAYAVINIKDGAEIVRSGSFPQITNPYFTWVQDGGAIAYAGPSTLEVLPAQPDAQPQKVLELDQNIESVRTTSDSNVLVATTREDHGSNADPASTDVDSVYTVNLSTGDTHEFDGMELGAMMPSIRTTNALLMFDYTDATTISVRIYNPASGELLKELNDLPNPVSPDIRATMGKNSYAVSNDGRTQAFAVSAQNIIVVLAQDRVPVTRQLDPPSSLSGIAMVTLSPNGTTLSLMNMNDEARTRWLLDLTEPNAEWLKLPNEGVGNGPGMIQFVGGTRP